MIHNKTVDSLSGKPIIVEKSLSFRDVDAPRVQNLLGQGVDARVSSIQGDEESVISRPNSRTLSHSWEKKVVQARTMYEILEEEKLVCPYLHNFHIPMTIRVAKDKLGKYAIIEKVSGEFLDKNMTTQRLVREPVEDKTDKVLAYLTYLNLLNKRDLSMVDHKASSLVWSNEGRIGLVLVDPQYKIKEINDRTDPTQLMSRWDATIGKFQGKAGMQIAKGFSRTIEAISIGSPKFSVFDTKWSIPVWTAIPYGIKNLIVNINRYNDSSDVIEELAKYRNGEVSDFDITSSQKAEVVEVLQHIVQNSDVIGSLPQKHRLEIKESITKLIGNIKESTSIDIDRGLRDILLAIYDFEE